MGRSTILQSSCLPNDTTPVNIVEVRKGKGRDARLIQNFRKMLDGSVEAKEGHFECGV